MKKVLHIIESFDGQAIEQWLYQMMCHMKKVGREFDWTFFVTLGQPGRMDALVKDIGGKIIYSPVTLHKKKQFIKSLREILTVGGFDIIHSHHDLMSAIYFLASVGLSLESRIIHVHNTTHSLPISSRIKNLLLREPMRQICLCWADRIVGVSNIALDTFLKGRKRNPKRHSVIHCGINTAPFHRQKPDKKKFLLSLGLPEESRCLLFVGRMNSYKNPCFVLEVLDHLSKSIPEICAIFAGSGPLETVVRTQAEQKSLTDRVRVLGWQDDIPALMQQCDLLIWPGLESPKEGLGLGVVEAQAAGLPVLMSYNVPEEAIVVSSLVEVLPLAAGASVWATKVLQKLNQAKQSSSSSLAEVEASSFSIANSTKNILALYDTPGS